MVSNQAFTISLRATAGTATSLALCGLLAGCQAFGWGSKEEAPPAAPPPPANVEVAPQPETAIDAAIARGEMSAARPAPAPVPGTETASLDGVAVNPGAPLTYTVKRGDTLWGISAMYLRDPWLWPEIWHVNPAVNNPHLIYPGDQLTLARGTGGEPATLTLTHGDALRVSPMVRSNSVDGPISVIPYEFIQAFLGKPGILAKEDLHDAPYVVGMRDKHIAAGAGMQAYVKGLDGASGRFNIIHPGEELKDPETGNVLGYMGIFTATARIEPTESDISRAVLLESGRETLRGDLVFQEELAGANEDIVPRAAPPGMKGQIMAVVDGVQLIGQYQVVAINRGTEDGVLVGHVMAVDQRGELVDDPACRASVWSWCFEKRVRLPNERAGTLLVFKTYEKMSFGLIVNATAPLTVADVVRAP